MPTRVFLTMKSKLTNIIFSLGLLILLPFASYAADPSILKIATTTSVENTGLLDYLLPQFTKTTGIQVKAIAVGSGQALQFARNGDVDLVMVHSPEAEKQFIADGYGVDRQPIMTNDFVIIGSASDPAKVKQAKTAIEAFKLIAAQKATFISRGDNSGTDAKEKELWRQAEITPNQIWYKEIGQGAEQALFMADNQQAYTLTDRSTYSVLESKLNLIICFEGDPSLKNTYTVITVNPKKNPQTNYQAAKKFTVWLTSRTGQDLIANFKPSGTTLFLPAAP